MSTSEIRTRLYIPLSAHKSQELTDVGARLVELNKRLDIACVSLQLGPDSAPLSPNETELYEQLIRSLQQNDIAVLAQLTSEDFRTNRKSFEKSLEKAFNLGVDGVHMSADGALFARARDVLGAQAIIGADCGASRHEAMELGESGADYVAFTSDQENDTAQTVELVKWWQDLFEVPCVAANISDPEDIKALALVPADFIALDPAIWTSLESEPALLEAMLQSCPALAETT